MKATSPPAPQVPQPALPALLDLRPGFLLWHAHQLSVGLFEEGCKDVALTPWRYGVLPIVGQTGGCDQAAVARGFDRVTTLRVVRGLLARPAAPAAKLSRCGRYWHWMLRGPVGPGFGHAAPRGHAAT